MPTIRREASLSHESTGGRGGNRPSLVVVLSCALLAGCKGERGAQAASLFASASEAAGITDRAPPPPEAIDLLCQSGPASPCDPRRFSEALDATVAFALQRPGSRLRFWVVRGSAREVVQVAALTIPERGNRSARRAQQEERQFLEATRNALCPSVVASLGGSRDAGAALAEAFTKVSLAPTRGLPRRVIVLSDGYEQSGVARFRCRPLPTVAQWQALLTRRGLIPPGGLAHTTIHFGLMDLGVAADRPDCPTPTVARDLHVRELWRSALTRAGATRVTFDLSTPDLDALAREPSPMRRTP